MPTKNILTGDAERFVRSARVARLASAAPDGRPHVITASATLELDERERAAAVRALKLKYPQYQTMLPDDAYVIMTPIRYASK